MKKLKTQTAKRGVRRLVLNRHTVMAMGDVATETPEPSFTASCDGTFGICP